MTRDHLPGLNERAWAGGGGQTGRTGVNKRGAISIGVDLFELDDKFGWIMFGIGQHFGAKEGDDMVRDDLDGLILEVGVVDTEVRVEPLDFIRHELVGNETLEERANGKEDESFCLDKRALRRRDSLSRQRSPVLWHAALLFP